MRLDPDKIMYDAVGGIILLMMGCVGLVVLGAIMQFFAWITPWLIQHV